ncbi:MAG: prolyl oligopeptidase family serine peptidase [Planctomycetota bacterium]
MRLSPSEHRALRRLYLRALGLAVVLGLTGVVGLRLSVGSDPAPGAPRAAAPLAPDVAARFAYPEHGTPAPELARFNEAEGLSYTRAWVQLTVTTPGDDAPHRVQVIHYRPRGLRGPAPAVVVSPILGGSGELAHSAAVAFTLRGMHAAVVLKAESYFDAAAPLERLECVLRTAVIDRRRAVDWLQARDDVDPAAIGAFGASMGGVITTLLAAVEPRVQRAAIALAGGDLPHLVASSEEPRVARFAEELGYPPGVDRAPLVAALQAALESDPLDLAASVDPARVLFVETTRDRDMPSAQQAALYEALGRPARLRLPCGHTGAVAYWPYLTARVSGYLAEGLSESR